MQSWLVPALSGLQWQCTSKMVLWPMMGIFGHAKVHGWADVKFSVTVRCGAHHMRKARNVNRTSAYAVLHSSLGIIA